MKNLNWINKFIEEQKIKADNRECLKAIRICLILLDHQKSLQDLNKTLIIQKRRITRQLNEQNKENEFSSRAFDNIFNRLDKLEKHLFIKENGKLKKNI